MTQRLRAIGKRGYVGATAFVTLVLVLVAYFVLPGSVNGGSLGHSIMDAAGGTDFLSVGTNVCREAPLRGDDQWKCEIQAEGGSRTVLYEVEVSDGGCWTGQLPLGPRKDPLNEAGERLAQGELWPAHIHGCVKLGDNVRLVSRLVSH